MRVLDLLGGAEIIPTSSCMELLGQETVGRLGIVVDGRAEIFPVNYVLDGDSIVFATNAGRKLLGLLAGPATFEVDHLYEEQQSGWSVVVHGEASVVSAGDDRTAPGPQPWAGTKSYVVRIAAQDVTGRRVADGSF